MIFRHIKFDLNYEIAGNRESDNTLVFLNGVFHGSASWLKQVRYKPIANNYRFLFIDYPGFGDGSKLVRKPYCFEELCRSIIALLRHLELNKTVLIGYSLGGIIAQHLVRRSPDLFSKLILVNSAHRISTKGLKLVENVNRMLVSKIDLSTIFANVYPWFFSERYLNQLKTLEHTVLQRYIDYNSSTDEVIAFLDACATRGESRTAELGVPVQLIGCDGDIVCPLDIQKEFVSKHPHTQWHLLKCDSHVANVEHHVEVNKTISSFLSSDQRVVSENM